MLSQSRLHEKQLADIRERAAERSKKSSALYKEATEHRVKAIYTKAVALQAEGTEESLSRAIKLFAVQPNYKDSVERMKACQQRIPQLQAEKKKQQEQALQAKVDADIQAKKVKQVKMILGSVALIIVVFAIGFWCNQIGKQNAIASKFAGKTFVCQEERSSHYAVMKFYKDGSMRWGVFGPERYGITIQGDKIILRCKYNDGSSHDFFVTLDSEGEILSYSDDFYGVFLPSKSR